jgi:hypothetical protein
MRVRRVVVESIYDFTFGISNYRKPIEGWAFFIAYAIVNAEAELTFFSCLAFFIIFRIV